MLQNSSLDSVTIFGWLVWCNGQIPVYYQHRTQKPRSGPTEKKSFPSSHPIATLSAPDAFGRVKIRTKVNGKVMLQRATVATPGSPPF